MINQQTSDQELVEKFLKEFVEKLTAGYSQDIDFVLLFGSAARGEWKKGVSDVDMVIQLKKKEKVSEVSERVSRIFWELDDKYGTMFKEVCSSSEKDALDTVLKETRLYVPFEIFGPDDLDWKKSEVKKPELVLGARLIASQGTLFKKMKIEGKILFGRDIRQEIKLKKNPWEKFKALLVPLYLSFFSVVLSVAFPKRSLRMAQKAALYAGESVVFFLDLPLGRNTKATIDELEKDIKKNVREKFNLFNLWEVDILFGLDWIKITDFNFIKQALKLKYDWENSSPKLSRWNIVGFCFRSFFFVIKMDWYALWRKKPSNKSVK